MFAGVSALGRDPVTKHWVVFASGRVLRGILKPEKKELIRTEPVVQDLGRTGSAVLQKRGIIVKLR